MALLWLVGLTPLSETRLYPPILDSAEYVHRGLAMFPKWADMLARWDAGAPCEAADCTMSGWQDLVDDLKGKDLMAQLTEVNDRFNVTRYTLDTKNWGSEDYWETPYEFLKRKGDCEDYAIAKFMALKAAGVAQENMRILALEDMRRGTGHAVLIVYDGDMPWMLDNQIKSVVPVNSVVYYRPIYSINETGWWRHRS